MVCMSLFMLWLDGDDGKKLLNASPPKDDHSDTDKSTTVTPDLASSIVVVGIVDATATTTTNTTTTTAIAYPETDPTLQDLDPIWSVESPPPAVEERQAPAITKTTVTPLAAKQTSKRVTPKRSTSTRKTTSSTTAAIEDYPPPIFTAPSTCSLRGIECQLDDASTSNTNTDESVKSGRTGSKQRTRRSWRNWLRVAPPLLPPRPEQVSIRLMTACDE
jgi:hypothetical protein